MLDLELDIVKVNNIHVLYIAEVAIFVGDTFTLIASKRFLIYIDYTPIYSMDMYMSYVHICKFKNLHNVFSVWCAVLL